MDFFLRDLHHDLTISGVSLRGFHLQEWESALCFFLYHSYGLDGSFGSNLIIEMVIVHSKLLNYQRLLENAIAKVAKSCYGPPP